LENLCNGGGGEETAQKARGNPIEKSGFQKGKQGVLKRFDLSLDKGERDSYSKKKGGEEERVKC